MAISYGSKGAAVASLQSQLTRAGFLTGSSDGIYGNNTESAVQRAYAALGVPGVSGAASDELLGALQAKVGSGGGSVIGAMPPGGGVVQVDASDSSGFASRLASLPLPVKAGLGLAGVVVLASVFSKK